MMDQPPIAHELAPKPWFRAKRIGYGTGMPMAWQGWVMLLAHCVIIIAVSFSTMGQATWLRALLITVVALLPMPLYRAKTERRPEQS
jgi:hypothetical protein